jgi:hypothetical protein
MAVHCEIVNNLNYVFNDTTRSEKPQLPLSTFFAICKKKPSTKNAEGFKLNSLIKFGQNLKQAVHYRNDQTAQGSFAAGRRKVPRQDPGEPQP